MVEDPASLDIPRWFKNRREEVNVNSNLVICMIQSMNAQRFFGTGKLPWQWIPKSEVKTSLNIMLKENISSSTMQDRADSAKKWV